MARKVYAQISIGLTGLLALLWFLILTLPVNYLRFENLFVGIEVTLWYVYIDSGMAPDVANSALAWLTGGDDPIGLGTDVVSSLTDIKMKVCAVDMRFLGTDLCTMWEHTWYASWAMVVMGYFCVIFLTISAISQYYYSYQHATETGRMWVRVMSVLGPMCAILGTLGYCMLTMTFGQGIPGIAGSGQGAAYGNGVIYSCTLCVLSFIPLYIVGVLGKRDSLEKRRGEGYSDDEDGIDLSSAPGPGMYPGMPQGQGGQYGGGSILQGQGQFAGGMQPQSGGGWNQHGGSMLHGQGQFGGGMVVQQQFVQQQAGFAQPSSQGGWGTQQPQMGFSQGSWGQTPTGAHSAAW